MRRTIRDEPRAELRVRGRFAPVGRDAAAAPCGDDRASFQNGLLDCNLICAPVREAHLALLVRVVRVVAVVPFIIIGERYDFRLAG